MSRRSLTIRAVLLPVALACIVLGPGWLQALAGVVTLANVGELCARLLPGEEPVARVLTATLAILVALIVLGLILDAIPGGLTTTGWAIAWTILGLAALVPAARRLPPAAVSRAGRPQMSPALVLSVALLAGGLAAAAILAESGTRLERSRPLLALSATWHDTHSARILVQSVAVGGRYVVRTLPDGHGPAAAAATITLDPHRRAARSLTIALPAGASHWIVELVPDTPGATAEREVILWS